MGGEEKNEKKREGLTNIRRERDRRNAREKKGGSGRRNTFRFHTWTTQKGHNRWQKSCAGKIVKKESPLGETLIKGRGHRVAAKGKVQDPEQGRHDYST